jgi:integrase
VSERGAVRVPRPRPPASYLLFLEDARAFVESKGIRWEQSLDNSGAIVSADQWDLRVLTDSHARNASRISAYRVIEEDKEAALRAGWNPAALPQGVVLHQEVREFIKSVVAHRSAEKILPRSTRHMARVMCRVFSVVGVMPWEISTDDINRYLELVGEGSKAAAQCSVLCTIINQNALSIHVPLRPGSAPNYKKSILESLDNRDGGHKLPDRDAFYELARIAFQEEPRSHLDLLRFSIIRILILTGLRINEVLMLPLDCLVWEQHFDVVTGKPAGECGGISRSLRLKYFAEKHEEFAPDHLVEEVQWVPERFQKALVDAVKMAQEATVELRKILVKQHATNHGGPWSDLRKFRTTSGGAITTADMLFIAIPRSRSWLPARIDALESIGTISVSSLYKFLGSGSEPFVFARYGKDAAVKRLSIKPHSLRHLMNTELFRLELSDTVITQHFGRKSVTQSYEYDHRSLSEKLSFVELPAVAAGIVDPGTPQELVAKMVVSGSASGSHLAESFRKIQAEHGDNVAFKYLVANSDGFHVTPYGYCTNSFSLNPCARHLKCFDRCKHFAASGMKEHVSALKELQVSLREMKAAAERKPPMSVGRRNQIEHADRLIIGVTAALDAQPRSVVFPAGEDHSSVHADVLA